MIVRIEQCGQADLDDWVALRAMLWPDATADGYRKDIVALQEAEAAFAGFIGRSGQGRVIAFAEASVRGDYVNGCETSPVLSSKACSSLRATAGRASRAASSRRSKPGRAGRGARSSLPMRFSTTPSLMPCTVRSISRRPSGWCISGRCWLVRRL